MAPFIVRLITLLNINRFSKFFHCQNQEQFAIKLSLQIPPHLKYVATLPREMSDDGFLANPVRGYLHNEVV